MKKILSLAIGFLIAFDATATTPPDPVKSSGTHQEISSTVNSNEFNAIQVYKFVGIDYPISTVENVTFEISDSAANQICLNVEIQISNLPFISPAEKLQDNWCQIQKVWFYSGYQNLRSYKKYNPPNTI